MPQSPYTKAPDDPGAFGMLTPDQMRILKGAIYRTTARVANTIRAPEDWSFSFLAAIHKRLFEGVMPEFAGKLRLTEVSFRVHAIPTPGQIQYRLLDVVREARSIMTRARVIEDDAKRIEAVFPAFARFHATCIVTQPFIDGKETLGTHGPLRAAR